MEPKPRVLPWRRRPSFGMLCVVMAFENIAANVVHPVEPAFYIALGLPDWIFGAAFASMAAGLFLFAPLWGLISDHIGRIPALAVAGVTYGLAQLAFLVSTNVPAILVSRFAAGATCSGCMVSAMAYVADISEPAERGKRMAVYAAITGCFVALGYLLGGFVGLDDPGRSFILQFGILVLMSVLAILTLGEAGSFQPAEGKLTLAKANPLSAFRDARHVMTPWLTLLLAGVALSMLASAAFDNSFNYYLRDHYAMPTTANGIIYAVVGIIGLAANLTVGLRLQRARRGELALAVVLGLASVTLLATLAFTEPVPYVIMNMVFYTFNSLYMPIAQALALNCGSNHNGAVSGMFQSMRSLGMVVGSLTAGFIYELAPLSPMVMASIAFGLAGACVWYTGRIKR